jgi:hypothetical protein
MNTELLYVGSYLLAALILIALYIAVVKSATKVGLLIFFLLPTIVSIYWGIYGDPLDLSTFSIAKFYSAFAGTAFLQWLLIAKWKPVYGKVIYWLLAVNILEAVLTDYSNGSKLNALVGILLIISQPSSKTVSIASSGKALLYQTPWLWVISYTIWNFTFVYSISGTAVVLSALHLGIPLILCFKNNALYLQARAYILSFTALIYCTPFLGKYIRIQEEVFYPNLLPILVGVSLVLGTWTVYDRFKKASV